MAESSGFFNAELVNGKYDREYLAKHFAKYFSLFIANGVFPNPSDGLQVFENTTADMNVLMHPGYGWINGYWYGLDGNLTLAIEPADGVLNRIDSIMVRWDQEKRQIYAKVVRGTPASQPTAPNVTRNADFYDLCVAQIRVDAGTTKIMQSMITDTRMNSSLCGIVTGVVKSIDTTTLFEQYQAALREFQAQKLDEFDKWSTEQKNAFAAWVTQHEEEFNTWTAEQQAEFIKWTTEHQEAFDQWQAQEKSDFDAWFATIKDSLDGDTAGKLLNLINARTGINATATHSGTVVAITITDGTKIFTFIAPTDFSDADTYTLNGSPITLLGTDGKPVKKGWVANAPVTFKMNGTTAYYTTGGGGDYLPLAGGTMTGPAVGAAGELNVAQFRNVQYGDAPLTPGVSELPKGTLYISGKKIYYGDSSGKAKEVVLVPTDSELLESIKRVDGPGSGLDADTLDGKQASSFANASHTHPASQITSGTLSTSVVASQGTDYTTSRLRNIKASTSDLSSGSSPLESGTIYLVYE